MIEYGEDYILHDAADKVFENAEAKMDGLPVRQEVFRISEDGTFYYEKRQGFEGQKLEKKFGVNGTYTLSGKVLTLEWPETVKSFTPELVKKYTSLIAENLMLRSATNKNLIFC